eukprot:TRINITY_DN209_c0_g5_i1.p1 TRINITY_DN209_c0_g5~~TRINITY_DN209_c0_g5_i1.p1  ORF type:complete len:508 (+),score=111.81 TRINITY_DN209_c0_g5_i1:79-1602(+)
MKCSLVVLVLALFIGVSTVSGDYPAGMVTTITQAGITYATNVATKIATVALNNLTIPDQWGKEDTLRYIIAGIKLSNVAIPSATVTLQNNNQLFVQFLNVAGEISAAWWAREEIWPNPKGVGTFQAVWIGVTINALLDFSAAGGKPTVTTPYTLCHIANFDIHIDGHGPLEQMASLLKTLFARPIKALIEKEITTQMATAINQDLNSYIQTLPTDIPVGHTATFNATLVPPNININSNALSINVRGMFADTTNPADIPPYTPTTIPQILSNNEMIQIFIGSWVPDSASWIFTRQGKLNISVTEALMKSSPFPFNTNNWKSIAPGLASKYPNLAIVASLGPLPGKPPATFFATTGITTYFYLGLDFAVVEASGAHIPVFSIGMNFTTKGEITVQNGKVVSSLSFLGISITVLNTFVGPIDTNGLNSELNYVAQQVLLPYINAFTQQGLQIPIFYGIELVNTQIVYGNGYIGILSNVQYGLLDAAYTQMNARKEPAEVVEERRARLFAL